MGRSRDLADGTLAELNVDSNTLAIDATNNRVGIGTASPSYDLDVLNTTAGCNFRVRSTNAGSGAVIQVDGSGAGSYPGYQLRQSGTHYWSIQQRGDTNLHLYRENGSGGIITNGAGISFDNGSNYLDDYEEGSFSPTVTGSSSGGPFTFSTNNCRYVKIGRLVKASYWLVHDGSITFSGAYKITLPFTVSGDYAGGGYISYIQNFIGTKPDLFQIEANTNFGYLRRLISTSDNQQFDLDQAMFQTNTGFMLTVMYETNL